MENNKTQKLSLIGSVSLGTGVMIGAGIFVLMGQIAELVGDLFPIAFIYLKYLTDPFVLIVTLIGIVLIILGQRLFMISHTGQDGKMQMDMDGEQTMKM